MYLTFVFQLVVVVFESNKFSFSQLKKKKKKSRNNNNNNNKRRRRRFKTHFLFTTNRSLVNLYPIIISRTGTTYRYALLENPHQQSYLFHPAKQQAVKERKRNATIVYKI